MKFSIKCSVLNNLLKLLSGASEKRGGDANLANVLLAVRAEEVKVQAQDPELEISAWREIDVDNTGDNKAVAVQELGIIALSYKKIYEVARAFAGDTLLQIERKNDRVMVYAGTSKLALRGFAEEAYPERIIEKNAVEIRVFSETLKDLIDKTSFAMGEDDVRFFLNGMLFEFNQERCTAAAADGHRMAVAHAVCEQADLVKPVRVIVPRRAVLEIQKLLATLDGYVTLLVSEKQMQLIAPQIQLKTRLLGGKFPSYEAVVPQGSGQICYIDRQKFRDAILKTNIVLHGKIKCGTIKIADNAFQIYARNDENDEVEVGLEVDYSGRELEISFNLSYLLDFLDNTKQASITFTFFDATKGVVLAPRDEANTFCVIMPLRV